MPETTTQPDAVKTMTEAIAEFRSVDPRNIPRYSFAANKLAQLCEVLVPDLLHELLTLRRQAEANRLLIEVGKAAVEEAEALHEYNQSGINQHDATLAAHKTAISKVNRLVSAYRASLATGGGR